MAGRRSELCGLSTYDLLPVGKDSAAAASRVAERRHFDPHADIGGSFTGIHAAVMTSCPIHPSHHLRLICALATGFLLATLPGPARLFGQTSTIPASYTVDRHYGLALDRQLWLDPLAHGYQHGYEDGFHRGEWAHQMFEHAPSIRKQSEWKHADRGYQPAMGNREEFRHGYRRGYEQGFEDAYSGYPFQALMWLQLRNPAFACLSGCRPALAAARPTAPR